MGALNTGLSMSTTTGLVTGTMTTVGSYSWTVHVTDSHGNTSQFVDTSIVTEGRRFITTGSTNGKVAYSLTGLGTWSEDGSGMPGTTLRSFANNGNVVVGCTTAGQFYRSTDRGATWVATTNAAEYIGEIAYGNDLFVAVGPLEFTWTSTDNGLTWTRHAVSITVGNNGSRYVTFCLGFFVIGFNVVAAETAKLCRTMDGYTITDTTSYGGGAGFAEMHYDGAQICVTRVGNGTLFSTDGITFTSGTTPAGGGTWGAYAVCGQDGYFLVSWTNTSGNGGIYKTTNNGATWTNVYPTAFEKDIGASGGGIDIMGGNSTSIFVTSDAGATWATPTVNVLNNIQYLTPP